MTQRERILAGCLLGALVGYGGYKLVQAKVVAPRRKMLVDIKEQRALREKLEVRLNGAEKIVRDWQEQAAATLHPESFAAHQAFREDVALLLERNNLTRVAGWTISETKESRYKKGARKGFVELPLSVRVTGTLGDLVNFLKDLYRRPYLVRMDKLSLSVESGGKSSGRKRTGGREEPRLSIVMKLSTLVLPKVKEVEHATIDLAAMNDPESELALTTSRRLTEEDLLAYNEIPEKNIFKMYEPPPVAMKPVQRKPVERKPAEEDLPERKPPVDPRRDAHKFVLQGVGQRPEGPVAYVYNTDNTMEPPAEYHLNDDVDDGKLVLIVSEGMVVRVSPEEGQHQAPKDYFYPLGANFKEREEVRPDEHPDIARLLRLVLKQ